MRCSECIDWETNEAIEQRYGEGCGYCMQGFGDEYNVTFCNKECVACRVGEVYEKNTESGSEKVV